MAIYLRGLMMGLAYVAPIGTQNLFVINTAVTQQRKKAFATAAIVAFFDISLSLACFFGVGALMEALLAGPDEPSLSSPIPEGTALKSLKVSGRRAQIDLSAQYARLTGIDLSLADYCSCRM